jgi:alpha-N-arabinofuranosidase
MKTTISVVSVLMCSWAVGGEFHVSPNGSDTHEGSQAAPLRTISAAANKARPGDIITVHEGVYRERINPPKEWFHDLLRKDGTPFDPSEAALFRALTDRK